MSNVLTASGLLGRRTSVEWHEAVALVRAVVECLVRDGGQAHDLPELDQIEIAPDGSVDVVGVTRTQEPVRRLGQLLQALFGQSGPPVQLRLIISQAMATSASFGSIHEFDQALGYFERPGRDAILQALYARAVAAPLSEVQSPLTLDTVAPVSEPAQQERRRTRAARRRVLWRSVAAGLVGVLCVAGVQYARDAGVTPSAPEVIANARQVADIVDASVLSGLSAITERAGLGRLVPADADVEESSADATVSPSPRPAARTTAADRSRTQATPAVIDSQTPASELNPHPGPVIAFDLNPTSIAPLPTAAPSVLSNMAPAADEADQTIYSAESTDVLPPVGVRPVLPTELPPNLRLEDLLFISVTVLPNGTVGAVKLMGTPRNMQEGMWLSAVKAFEFLPALKDGVPVRYQKNVWIAPR